MLKSIIFSKEKGYREKTEALIICIKFKENLSIQNYTEISLDKGKDFENVLISEQFKIADTHCACYFFFPTLKYMLL